MGQDEKIRQEADDGYRRSKTQWFFLIPLVFVCMMVVVLLLPRDEENLSYLLAEHSVPTLTPGETKRDLAWQQLGMVDKQVVATLGQRVIALPKDADTQVSVVEDDYVNCKVCVRVEGLSGETIQKENLQGVYGESYVLGFDMMKSYAGQDVFNNCEITYEDTEEGTKTATIWFEESTVYECRIAQDAHYFYLDWYRPKELYDKIVVLDAGHGGDDWGAVASDGKTYEKDVVLSYLLGVKALADAQDEIKFYYTRVEDKNCSKDYSMGLQLRTDLVAHVEADLFLSLHLNAHESQNFHGTEMYYNETQDNWDTFHSKAFAELVMEHVTGALGLSNNGYLEAATTLSIVKYSTAPVVLAELGYISNSEDLQVLLDPEKKVATEAALLAAIQEAFRVIDEE